MNPAASAGTVQASGLSLPGLTGAGRPDRRAVGGDSVTSARYNSAMPEFPPLAPAEGTGPLPLVGTPVTRRIADRGPLPDAVAVRQIPVPDTAPPYDDAGSWSTAAGADPSVGPAICVLTNANAATNAAPPDGEPVVATPAARAASAATSDRVAATAVPAPRSAVHGPWPSQFAQVLAETLAGSRPPRQIVPWTTEQTRKRISQLGPLLATAQQPRVRRVIVTCPAPDVLEMTIIVSMGQRVRALAVRLERIRAARPGHPAEPRLAPREDRARAPGRAPTPGMGHRAGPEPTARAGGPDQPDRWCCTALEAA